MTYSEYRAQYSNMNDETLERCFNNGKEETAMLRALLDEMELRFPFPNPNTIE